MKKNLISILILALLVVNLVMTSIMMFSITGASKKTSKLVTDIASAMQLEISAPEQEGEKEQASVPMEDVDVYQISSQMTLTLKPDSDGTPHYAKVSVAFTMNKKDKGYKKYSGDLATKEPILKDIVNEVFATHTIDEVIAGTDDIKKEILAKVQAVFDSEFIYDMSFGEITPM